MDDLLFWLSRSNLYPKFFWKFKENRKAYAAAGKKRDYFHLPQEISTTLYGGCSFSCHSRDPLWNFFPPCYFFEPIEERSALLKTNRPLPSLYLYKRSTDLPLYPAWQTMVNDSLQKILENQLQKVVLARKTSLIAQQDNDPWDLFAYLLATAQKASFFAFQPEPGPLFFGATPETLFMRKKDQVKTEAVAGTKCRSERRSFSEKEHREFLFVQERLGSLLAPYCDSLSWSATTSIRATNLTHLYAQLSGKATKEYSDGHLLSALHPTPAIGGEPREKALRWIEEIEPFSRGWYSGPIGRLSMQRSEISVAIRSALAQKHELHLYAGAGIIAGSDPHREWNELEQKIALYGAFLSL